LTNGQAKERVEPSVWVNIAHMYLLRGKYGKAIMQYQLCLREFASSTASSTGGHYTDEVSLQLCLAAAYFRAKRFQV
jgi:hypothetical protein